MAHTAGPWSYEKCTLGHPSNSRNPIVEFNGGHIARLFSPDSTLTGLTSLAPPIEEVEANARLIACAPELLSACEKAMELVESECMGANGWVGPGKELGPLLQTLISKAKQ